MTAGELIHLVNTRSGHTGEISKESKLEQILTLLFMNINLDMVDSAVLDLILKNPEAAGGQLTNFLNTTGKLLYEESVHAKNIIAVDRTQLFDPVQFMHHRGLEIAEQDERSVMLEEIDLSGITLVSMLRDELVITGEEHLLRLKEAKHIRLDARIFQTLWENQYLIPDLWKGHVDHPNHIFFDGTVLRNQFGRYIIGMYWDRDERWSWTYCRLDLGGWRSEDVSAVIQMG